MVPIDLEIVLFAHARTAFWYGLQQLPLESRLSILVPDYICESILHPLEDLGIKASFYPVDDSFVPDWKVLEALVRDEPAYAFLLVHFFGQPQDIKRAREFCDQNGLYLIEDNSHGHGGKLYGQALGSFGDIGFSSPRKQLKCASGGILYLNGKPLEFQSEELSTYPISSNKELIRRLVRLFPYVKGLIRRILKPEPNFNDPTAFPEIRIPKYLADEYSSKLILSEDWAVLAEGRRKSWKKWSRFALEVGLQPIWQEPHPECCPWALPVYANSQEDRAKWLRLGWMKGLDFYPWPTLPKTLLQYSKKAVERWKRMLCIPLDQTPD